MIVKLSEDRFGDDGNITGMIVAGICVRQAFVAHGKLKAVLISFATFRRKNSCLVDVAIYDKFNNRIVSKTLQGKKIQDNRYHRVAFDVDLEPGRQYELRISSQNGTFHNSITGKWGGQRHPTSFLFVGARRVLGELSCVFQYERSLDEQIELMAREGRTVTFNFGLLESFLKAKHRKLSIVILNKDQPDMLEDCLERIQQHVLYDDYEVVIGDTGSTDPRTFEVYKKMPPNFRVVEGLDFHFGKNNNELVRAWTTGYYLLFMNNDILLDEDSVTKALEPLMCYTVGTTGIRLVKEHGLIDHDGQLLYQHGAVCVPDHFNVNREVAKTPAEDAFVQGNTAAFMLTRRDIFDAVGGFDEVYDDIYQDCDYMMKVSQLGFRHYCVRSTSARHLVSATRGKMTSTHNKTDIEKYREKWEGCNVPAQAALRPAYSFVTCCNNPSLYLGMIASLPMEIFDAIEFSPVQNRGNYFTVTQALNLSMKLSIGDYLVCCHQDVVFGPGWYENLTKNLMQLGDGIGVVGFEGVGVQGDPHSWKHVNESINVQTVDELCFVLRREYKLRFDEGLRFHYYGVDICLEALSRGLQNFVVGASIAHLSGGADNIKSDPESFKREAEYLWRKWCGNFKTVFTTTTNFSQAEGIRYLICSDLLNEGK